MTFKIHIVEDDPWYGQVLLYHLSLNPDYEVQVFTTAKDFLANIYQNPDVVCMDFGLPDLDGEALLKEIQNYNKQIPIVIISGQEDIGVAVKLLKLGAKDYLIKDDHTKDMLWKSIINIRENQSLKREVEVLKEQLETKYNFESTIIGQSDTLKHTFVLVNKAIKSNINVSLTGETGTGKEMYAKAIHFNSVRKKQPFVAVNMGAISKDLAESELFGHEKGAFTGAIGLKKGKFEEANGGTLFLDEIGEMDLSLQTKLLRVIQEREVVRVGGNTPIKVDIRLISATHKKLSEEVKNGNFREDLFFRIMGLPIELPPLRNRGTDVIILAKHFVEMYAENNKIKAPVLTEKSLIKLKNYSYPGNVRELKAVIDLACVLSDGKVINEADLTFYELSNAKAYSDTNKTLKEFENEIISSYLKKYNNNVLEVAKVLEIGKSKIYSLIKSGEIEI